MKNKNKTKSYGKRTWLISLGIGILALLCFALLLSNNADRRVAFGVSLAVILLGNMLYLLYLRRKTSVGDEKLSHSLGQIMLEMVVKMQNPMVICDMSGKIIWRNGAFSSATQSIGSVMGANIETISSLLIEQLEGEKSVSAELCERRYNVDPLRFKTDEKHYLFLIFTDCSEIDNLKAANERERSVVAYIVIDNLDELSNRGQEAYRSEANDVSNQLRDFAAGLNGILCEYDRNKYLLLMNHDGLMSCCRSSFDILDKVRDIRVGDLGLPITISMGITGDGDTLAEREAGAREALSLALARGGDQVVYKHGDETEFFGGNSRPTQKRSNVAAKVRSKEMTELIKRASNVIIMGHKGPDQACVGASAGLARLAMHCQSKPYIVVDKNDKNTLPFIEKFKKLPEYAGVFVDENEAQDLIESDTLLIVVDVNNIEHMLSDGIALSVNNALIIDHHRKTDSRVKRDWLVEYIEPSASSASELVAEILEQSIGESQLVKEEADALLGGIILDTKQFTKSTGARTFNAAIYLRNAGGNIYESSKVLRSDFGEFQKQSKILSDLVIYKGRFVIAKDEAEGEPIDRIAAAKAAESLLTIKGVDAAFALIRIGGETHISARSNASVNVQLILEKIGGGGHLDSAGAKSSDSMLTSLEKLKGAIDEYIEENDKSKK